MQVLETINGASLLLIIPVWAVLVVAWLLIVHVGQRKPRPRFTSMDVDAWERELAR